MKVSKMKGREMMSFTIMVGATVASIFGMVKSQVTVSESFVVRQGDKAVCEFKWCKQWDSPRIYWFN